MHTKLPDLVELDRRAVGCSVGIVDGVTLDQLALSTPCGSWTLGELLAHMTVQHQGFAHAALGERSDLEAWAPQALGANAAREYGRAAASVVVAFAGAGPAMWLPEIRDGGPFPAEIAVSFHLLDYVVHSWDVAVSIGLAADLPDDLVDAALGISAMVPDGAARTEAGAAFAPALVAGDGDSSLDRLLTALGRSPAWSR
jgi:uncharacterized protein (TIGR03086 family)